MIRKGEMVGNMKSLGRRARLNCTFQVVQTIMSRPHYWNTGSQLNKKRNTSEMKTTLMKARNVVIQKLSNVPIRKLVDIFDIMLILVYECYYT